jgi:uncharacterized UPF0160 family protein
MAERRDEITIVVHDGGAHMDEVLALAICTLWLDARGYGWEVIRSRDKQIIDAANIVFDVGGIYDPVKRRFDHHQREFDMVRSNGIGYASAGLAWKHYGLDLCAGDEAVWELVDSQLVQSVDAYDVGISLSEKIHPSGASDFGVNKILGWMQPTWNEDPERSHDAVWFMLETLREVVPRVIAHIRADQKGEELVRNAYQEAVDKRIIILEESYPWRRVLASVAEPQFVIYPRPDHGWSVSAVYAETTGFEMRAYLPEAWRGLPQDKLREISQIPSAIFCHPSGFRGGAETLEDAVMMAVSALLTTSTNDSRQSIQSGEAQL